MDIQDPVKSRSFKLALGIVGVLLLVFTSFASGVAVGLRKARYSYQWGENYERNFMGHERGNFGMSDIGSRERMIEGQFASLKMEGRGGMLELPRSIEGRDFRNAHGMAGTIISIAQDSLVVTDRDKKENTVFVTERTLIKDHMADVRLSDLKTGDQIAILGRPDDQGVIKADLIRIFCCNETAGLNNNNDND